MYSNISFVILLDFIFDHNKDSLKNLEHPQPFESPNTFVIGEGSFSQLDMDGVLKVIDHTSTAMGRRLLRSRLYSPVTDKTFLNKEYDEIERLLKNDVFETIQPELKKITDLDRMERRLNLGILHPMEFKRLVDSLTIAESLIREADPIPLGLIPKGSDPVQDSLTSSQLKSFLTEIVNTFELDNMNCLLNEINTLIFKKGVVNEIDSLTGDMESKNTCFDNLISVLSPMINNSKIYVRSTKTEGNFLSVTKLQGEKIKKETKSDLNLVFKDVGTKTKIFCNKTDDLQNNLRELNKKHFISFIQSIYSTHKQTYISVKKFITNLDVNVSHAKTAKLYNYTRPIIIPCGDPLRGFDPKGLNKSYFNVEDLRHPIIERVLQTEYIPHSLKLSSDECILLFGLNSAGKSSVMKASGIAVILAQSGSFVPAKKFEIGLFHSLYTRINSTDDVFKGLSTFSSEILELKSILNRCDEHSLIIGDELCASTEQVSALSIVASSIVMMSKKKSTFIFATHLHDLPKLKHISELKNVKTFHLSVDYSTENDSLVFNRTFKEGSGNALYGITVAKYLMKNQEFMNIALEIKNTMVGNEERILGFKKSRYNKSVYMDECRMCGSRIDLHTHHIHHQKDCEDGFVKGKPHLKMNSCANLMVLCDGCHTEIHTK